MLSGLLRPVLSATISRVGRVDRIGLEDCCRVALKPGELCAFNRAVAECFGKLPGCHGKDVGTCDAA